MPSQLPQPLVTVEAVRLELTRDGLVEEYSEEMGDRRKLSLFPLHPLTPGKKSRAEMMQG